MIERWKGRVAEGMQVRSSDGEKLGKVVACQAGGFVVEKGFLFPKDLAVPYDRITDIRGGEIFLALGRAEMSELGASTAGTTAGGVKEAARTAASEVRGAVGAIGAAITGDRSPGEKMSGNGHQERRVASHETLGRFGEGGEIRVPLAEEEIIASKHVEKVGEVHVRKEIITEEKQITVPVMREVIRVERVALQEDVRAGEKLFEDESYDIPISEEHVTVSKRPMVREEVRIGKEIQQAEETASTTVRRERAEIETMGPVRRAEAPSKGAPEMRAAAPKR
jgi:uncharacterized protein (TIGR02271 family)